MLLVSFRNIRGSLRELEKAVETLACGLRSYSSSQSYQAFTVLSYMHILNILLAGRHTIKNCDQGLKNTARGLRSEVEVPREALLQLQKFLFIFKMIMTKKM